MRRESLERIGMLVNGLSIALLFYLATALHVPDVPLPMRFAAWLLFGVGLVFVGFSVAAHMSRRESGLIERGVYGVVRHPMYLGAILLFLSWSLFLPHWIVVVISLANVAIVYAFMIQEERKNVARFGDAYHRYMACVPRANFVTGLLGLLWRRGGPPEA